MLTKSVQALLLFSLGLIVWYSYLPQSTHSLVKELTYNCEFSLPLNWRPGPYPPALSYCVGYNKNKYRMVMEHLATQANIMKDHEVLIAPEFGSDLRMIYVTSINTILMNPTIEEESTENGICVSDLGYGEVQSLRPSWVTVTFLNRDFKYDKITFKAPISCLIQAAIESFVGLDGPNTLYV